MGGPLSALAISLSHTSRKTPEEPENAIGGVRGGHRRIASDVLLVEAPEHRALLALRDRDAIGDDVMRRIRCDLDLEAILVERHCTIAEARASDDGVLNPLERTRTELKLAPGFLVRSAPESRCVVDRVGT
jgi:hypothetical protein